MSRSSKFVTRAFGAVLLAAVASTAIACGGRAEDHSASAVDELKWGPGWIPGQIPSTGPVPAGCLRIEDEQIGRDVTAMFGGRAVTFTAWTTKIGARHEYVGFTFVPTGAVAYAVKAGLETFYGTASTWVHPAGRSGSAAKGIGNITFCPAAPSDGGTSGAPGGVGGVGGGAACTADADCWSKDCGAGGVCSRGGLGRWCEDGARDCVSGLCSNNQCAPNPTGQRGDPCTIDAECWLGACVASVCQGGLVGQSPCRDAADCADGLQCSPTDTCVP